LIEKYREARAESGRPVKPKSNEDYILQRLHDTFQSNLASRLTTQQIVQFAQARKRGVDGKPGAGGYTIEMDLSKLGTVIRHMASLLDLVLPDAIAAARPTLLATWAGSRFVYRFRFRQSLCHVTAATRVEFPKSSQSACVVRFPTFLGAPETADDWMGTAYAEALPSLRFRSIRFFLNEAPWHTTNPGFLDLPVQRLQAKTIAAIVPVGERCRAQIRRSGQRT